MKKIRKIISILLVVFLFNSIPGYTYFSDIDGHWAEEDIMELSDKNLIRGVSIDLFEPDRSITRAEFFALVIRVSGFKEVKYRNVFNDVETGSWYANLLQSCFDNKFIDVSMMDEGYIKPDAILTREEAASIAVQAYDSRCKTKTVDGDISKLTDYEDISLWARSFVRGCYHLGIMKGVTPTTFSPKSPLSRAEATVIAKRLMEKSNQYLIDNPPPVVEVVQPEVTTPVQTQTPTQTGTVEVGEQISYGPDFTGEIIYQDDFEQYSSKDDLARTKWKIFENNAIIDVKSVSESSKAASFTRAGIHEENTMLTLQISPQKGKIVVEQKMMSENGKLEEGRLSILGSDGNYAADVRFNQNKLEIRHLDPSTKANLWEPVADFVPGKWYEVKLVLDVGSSTFDAYVDGVLKGRGWEFKTKVPNISKVFNFIFGDSQGAYYFDDFKITKIN